MWAPPPHGSHVIKTACQNHLMVKNERFQELDGQRFMVFWFDGQNNGQKWTSSKLENKITSFDWKKGTLSGLIL
jgi:hypothetical protein